MQTPKEVLDVYFLDTRYALLEVAAMFDRYDDAVARAAIANGDNKTANNSANDPCRQQLEDAVKILINRPKADRAETMLNHFSDK
ncbi:MAG: hypothetical protein LBJ00_11280 [Planctomycetaceae bacterium]|jgi:hypothetical protein|nr:hypothetical protein [Planctomycetaceae bacterium]